MKTIRLYHYTSPDHLPLILGSGHLKLTESNVSLKREHAGPDVVWLTTHDTPDAGHGLDQTFHDKRRIRITVELPAREVHRWKDWARAHGSPAETIATLSRIAGGAGSWRVVEKPIPMSAWVEVRDLHTDVAMPYQNAPTAV